MPKPLSIKFRLIISLAIGLSCITFLVLLLGSYLLSKQANFIFDQTLLGAAKSIEQRIFVRKGKPYIEMPYFALDTIEIVSEEKLFYRVETEEGELLAGFKGLELPKGKAIDEGFFYNTFFVGNDLRAVLTKVDSYGGMPIYITVAESLHGRNTFRQRILSILIGLSAITILLSVTIAIFSVQTGLQPLNKIQARIRNRSIHDLSTVNEQAPSEIQPLIDSINNLIIRIQKNIDYLQRFNADVSHQLRTPLAEIKTLIHFTKNNAKKNHHDEDLEAIENKVNFIVRTTQQLLYFAKTNQNLQNAKTLEQVDLSEFIKKTCIELTPKVYQNGQELIFENLLDDSERIDGDTVMLKGLLSNLIDNSLLYAHQDNTAKITVRVGKNEKKLYFEVDDEGPGVPTEHLSKITERFYRIDNQQPGSGLGLAIVCQIADFHNAKVELFNLEEKGLRVRVTF